MSVFDLIPTCSDAMSIYTLVALSIIVTGNIAVDIIFAKWILNEFKSIKSAIDGHDDYISTTAKTISKMSTDIAVVCACIKNIENDGTETRTALAEINRTLFDKLT